VGADDDRIRGFTMIGSEAGEGMAVGRRRCWLIFPIRDSAMPFSPIRPWPRDLASFSLPRQLAMSDRLRRQPRRNKDQKLISPVWLVMSVLGHYRTYEGLVWVSLPAPRVPQRLQPRPRTSC